MLLFGLKAAGHAAEFRKGKINPDDYDAIIFFNTAFYSKNFFQILNAKTSTKKVFLDEIDDFFVRKIINHPEIDLYIKREYYTVAPAKNYIINWTIRYAREMLRPAGAPKDYHQWLYSKWNQPCGFSWQYARQQSKTPFLPLSVSVPDPATHQPAIIKPEEKFLSLSFIGHPNNPERRRYINYLNNNSEDYGFDNSYISTDIVSQKEYYDILSNSQAGLSLRGVGVDTWRYWEIPSRKVALFSQRLPISINNDFIDGESAVFFSSEEELKQKFSKYILKSTEYIDIARNGHAHYKKYHTPLRRAQTLIDYIKRL